MSGKQLQNDKKVLTAAFGNVEIQTLNWAISDEREEISAAARRLLSRIDSKRHANSDPQAPDSATRRQTLQQLDEAIGKHQRNREVLLQRIYNMKEMRAKSGLPGTSHRCEQLERNLQALEQKLTVTRERAERLRRRFENS